MASPCGTSSGSSLLQNSGSEEDLQALMNHKKQKRMISNRESAKRSRMRKQKQLDDLRAQVNQLRKENSEIVTHLSLTTKNSYSVAAENSVLRTQMVELNNRLQSLNEILHCLHGNNASIFPDGPQIRDGFANPWNLMCMNQPIMASVDMFQYC